ncbi:MAG: DNA topoisomerase I [Methanomicrobiales archaeon]|nr:DNA topoisomerase I [Methanomicrobiales archaeon]
MNLIIAEKNLSAARIAQILAARERVAQKKDGPISVYTFGDTAVVGLKGHVVEVDFVEGYADWRSEERTPRSLIDAPTTKVPTEKKIIGTIQRLAKQASRVIIATDFDTEGELIGKETFDLVRQVNKSVPILRARFSAITPPEITAAFTSPTELDFALASAGEARQVIDLVWGASLTRFISLAAKRGGKNILSVGRVQSPTLAMIVDREKEIEEFTSQKYWMLSLTTEKAGQEFPARHEVARFDDRSLADAALARTKPPLRVTEVKEGEKVERPPSPFDTTGFLVAAGRLGFSAPNAMRVAEDLYMNGFISYPRTDNTVYPPSLALDGVLRTLESTEFGELALWVREHRRPSPTRGKKISTDHPPIHPTGAGRREVLGDERWKIYELVVRRFLATLSPDARWSTVKALLDAGGEPYVATGARLVAPGWRKVYPYRKAEDNLLPPLSAGEELPLKDVLLEEKETQPPPRYSQSRLILEMERLGLGTKSTRHEVIAKLLQRRYVEGNPLRPTLVGRAVVESLEKHAATITQPDMTSRLDSDMQEIKAKKQTRDGVVTESRQMLHQVFDQLEAHGDEIGKEIMGRTDEERTIGPCPACGGDLRIRQMGPGGQFIGCSRYPECSFNINLPSPMWGKAIKTSDVCGEHSLSHIRLIRKGARPWEIGCPLCSHISSNREALLLIPHVTEEILGRLAAKHIYTVTDLSRMSPESLAAVASIPPEDAKQLLAGASDVLVLLRRRSELRKFVRAHLPPKRGRSQSGIVKILYSQGINDIRALASADPALLVDAGMKEAEAETLQREARALCGDRALREAGVPAASLKKYREAGITSPEDFCFLHPAYLSTKTGLSLETVYRHVEMVCKTMGVNPPARITKDTLQEGRAGLLSLGGMDEATLEKLYRAGIVNIAGLRKAEAPALAAATGIPVERVRQMIAASLARRGKG